MTTYNYTKLAVVAFAIIILVDWFINGTFGFIWFALVSIPAIFVGEWYKNNKNSKPE